MCGISAIFGHSESLRKDLGASLKKIRHRGNHTFESITFHSGALGANRLAIVDESNGKQPVSNEDQTIYAVQNGEIFNYKELKKELEAQGIIVRSLSMRGLAEEAPLAYKDVDVVVDKERGQFNRKVKEVLKRKLRAYLAWKEHSYEELKNRRKFTLKYLRQHFEIIRMYMIWVKPYLKNIQRMQLDQSKTDTPDLIAAFESSMIEIETLAIKPSGPVNQCILMHYLFRTRPEMSYSQEYQRGPLHLGRIEIDFRAYAWTDKEIENYKKMKEHEDFQLLGIIDGSVKAALEALGDELMRYLKEAGEEFEEKKETKKAHKQAGPFLSIFEGFAELFSSFKEKKELKQAKAKKKTTQTDVMKLAIARGSAEASVKKVMWTTYHHFKKQHAMLNW